MLKQSSSAADHGSAVVQPIPLKEHEHSVYSQGACSVSTGPVDHPANRKSACVSTPSRRHACCPAHNCCPVVLQVIRLKGAMNEKEMELIELREQHMQLVVSSRQQGHVTVGGQLVKYTAACSGRSSNACIECHRQCPLEHARLHLAATAMLATNAKGNANVVRLLCPYAMLPSPGPQPGSTLQLGDSPAVKGQGHTAAGGGTGQQATGAGESSSSMCERAAPPRLVCQKPTMLHGISGGCVQ
jgi:hypothetical protein